MADSSKEIETVLNTHPLCWQIVDFLIDHEGAMDTVKGIAKFWVCCDELAAQSAMDCLYAAGVVVAQMLSSGVYYSLSADPRIRARLHERVRPTSVLRTSLDDFASIARS